MVVIGTDNISIKLKQDILTYLDREGIEYMDKGATKSLSGEFPYIAQDVAIETIKNSEYVGLLICETGVEMAIAANKFSRVRAITAYTEEVAIHARLMNDANILCLSSLYTSIEKACSILWAFMNTDFTNEEQCIWGIKQIEMYGS